MSRFFKRDYLLRITAQDGEQREISGLALNFEITKSVLSFPNLAKITLFNPAPGTIAALQRRDTLIELMAGYEDNTRLIFRGRVRNVIQGRQGVDRAITFYSADGEQDWRNARIAKTYSESVDMQTVIKDVLSTFEDSTIGALEGLPDVSDKLRGQTLVGPSKMVMDQFAQEYGFSWSIQDGEVTTVGIERALSGLEVIDITPATGMLGSPTVTEIGADVTTLLNNQLLPNRAFRIESVNADIALGNLNFRDIPRTTAEGLYKVQEVQFRGEFPRGAWTSAVKGLSLVNQ